MARWTAADIPDLTGRTAVVTGANSGLGFETAKALAEHGATVVMGCRDASRCATAADEIRSGFPTARLEPLALDLADLDSVRSFAAQVAERFSTLDLLVNNAGVMAPPKRMTTKQGFELQFGVNHLGHFMLSALLSPLYLRTTGSRVVTVSSFAHEPGVIDFDDLQHERDYTPYGAYAQAKLANILFMRELERRLRAASAETISVGAHPGFSNTNLQAAGPFLGSRPIASRIVLAGVRITGQSPAHGAEPQLYAATAPNVSGGEYFGPKYKARGPVAPSSSSAAAHDMDVAKRLWDVSEELTGVRWEL